MKWKDIAYGLITDTDVILVTFDICNFMCNLFSDALFTTCISQFLFSLYFNIS